ncbi:MAG: hypothetical protein COW18_04550 [Zetaproteobacteria bacterium CG12_big_fil_rev_8_21_14_0_65_54_13]|nr:MAG: hypothetical protein COW18_04550 [Zetaproteobacteria bacterium CG12_big_fil_rev_8_21_14_0_65_54_13]PIX55763.1 MAG: hypothetical protein COZ50_01045 [Zetaproteobacteria bacterium CG_4_10_14_3_um_filter_54_28]PJA26780.1 MAG: hypothetical protein CO188_13770 [Zetaproteobacteria bacterium CG_4_9_14_3_um_filter_54_145]
MIRSHLDSALLMMAARVFSIVIGLAGIPVLLSQLGMDNFAAWAVLLGGSLAFYTLEMGMTPTVVKFLAESDDSDNDGVSSIISNATALLVISFTSAGILLFVFASPLAAWLNLPDTALLSAGGLILFVYVAVGLSSLLRIGLNTFFAARRFQAVAGISMVQSIASNIIAWVAALTTQRLDLVLIAYWGAQLLVITVSLIWARREQPWHFSPHFLRWKTITTLLSHGFNLQFNELMYFVHFQFDKMIIAGFAGLSEVAHYEVASRAGQALRSLPFTAITTLLPTATEKLARGAEIWGDYMAMTRASGMAAVLFLLLPLAVSPIFLFAWVGQIGYHGRWVFMLLACGIAISVLAMPVSNFIQAMGKTVIDARFALVSITMNVTFSLILIQQWGKEGAAAGTALAISATGIAYMNKFHQLQGRRLIDTLRYLAGIFWPALFICLICYGLERIIEPLVISSRWYMGPAAVALYVGGLIAIVWVMVFTNRLGREETALLNRVPLVRAFVSRASSHHE